MLRDVKLASYRMPGSDARACLVFDDVVVDVARSLGNEQYARLQNILNAWQSVSGSLARIERHGSAALPIGAVALEAPVTAPSGMYCAGANYTDHLDEMTRAFGMVPEPEPHSVGLLPWHFVKPSTTITGHGSTVSLPARSQKVDWEVELAVVIGTTVKHATIENALDCVAGFTIANDLSARDLTFREPLDKTSPFYYDWVSQKCFDGSTPLGPWIVPTAAFDDIQNIGLKLWVNGVLKQDSNTRLMVFSVSEQIAKLSESLTLHPGDVILTGTPAGVGAARGEFLAPGNVVTSWIEGIGTLEYTIAA